MWIRQKYLFYGWLIFAGTLFYSEALDLRKFDPEDDVMGTFYDISPQLEYVLPNTIPNHRLQRRAQRSPSLRLRFGRSVSSVTEQPQERIPKFLLRWTRSDPDTIENPNLIPRRGRSVSDTAENSLFTISNMIHDAEKRSPSLRLRFGRRNMPSITNLLYRNHEKRWFGGDVNKKPIRSPSLRLRFGRRSDPSMPLRSAFDELMENTEEAADDSADGANYDYDNGINDYDEFGFTRYLRKPDVRLRWGRSMPMDIVQQPGANVENSELPSERDIYNAVLSDLSNSDKLRSMLLAAQNFDEARNIGDNNSEEFQRESRKPAPLRLRFGRSVSMKSRDVSDQKDDQKLQKAVDGENKA